jgi:hypothetical protein
VEDHIGSRLGKIDYNRQLVAQRAQLTRFRSLISGACSEGVRQVFLYRCIEAGN